MVVDRTASKDIFENVDEKHEVEDALEEDFNVELEMPIKM